MSLERFLMIFSSIAIILTIAIGVVCRYFLKISFAGSDEILTILALWLYFVGGIYGSYEDCHINADILSMFVKKETSKHIVNVLVKTISLAVSLVLASWAFQYLELCLKLGGKTLVYKLPMMCSRAALVVGYTVPVLYNVYHLILAIGELLRPSENAMEEEINNSMTGGGEA